MLAAMSGYYPVVDKFANFPQVKVLPLPLPLSLADTGEIAFFSALCCSNSADVALILQ